MSLSFAMSVAPPQGHASQDAAAGLAALHAAPAPPTLSPAELLVAAKLAKFVVGFPYSLAGTRSRLAAWMTAHRVTKTTGGLPPGDKVRSLVPAS